MTEHSCGCVTADLDPKCVFTEGSRESSSEQFVIPEGGWAEIHIDGKLADDSSICVMQVLCFCNKPDKHLPLKINGKTSGIRAGCNAAIIPKGGTYYLQYDGADIDFDAVVIPHENVSDLLIVRQCGVMA